jgi:hypothetical protein
VPRGGADPRRTVIDHDGRAAGACIGCGHATVVAVPVTTTPVAAPGIVVPISPAARKGVTDVYEGVVRAIVAGPLTQPAASAEGVVPPGAVGHAVVKPVAVRVPVAVPIVVPARIGRPTSAVVSAWCVVTSTDPEPDSGKQRTDADRERQPSLSAGFVRRKGGQGSEHQCHSSKRTHGIPPTSSEPPTHVARAMPRLVYMPNLLCYNYLWSRLYV